MKTDGKLHESDTLNALLKQLLAASEDVADVLGEQADYSLLNETSRDDAGPADFLDEGVRLSALASNRGVAVVKAEDDVQAFYFARLRSDVEAWFRALVAEFAQPEPKIADIEPLWTVRL